MNKLIALFVLCFVSTSFAVNPSEIQEYTHQGSLVTIRIVPKNRTAKLFIVGHKAAEMDFKQDAQILSVSLLQKNKKEILQLDRQGDLYEVRGLPERERPYQLMIEAQVKGQKEEMKIDIPSKKP